MPDYAPQTGCDDSTKEEFWTELQNTVARCDAEEILFLCGDLNGHVSNTQVTYKCHGNQGYGNSYEDGRRILDFAEAHDLCVCNTFFKKRNTHLVTYVSGNNKSQIDFILVGT